MQLRKHNRYRLEVPVIFSWEDAEKIRQQDVGLTRDISLIGAYVFTSSPPPLEANLKLKAFLPPVRSAAQLLQLHGQGRVVRVEPSRGEYRAGFAVVGRRFVPRGWEQ